jgi:anti-anti-sigma factor
MSTMSGIFEVEHSGDTLIVTPLKNLSELDYEQIQRGGRELLELLSIAPVKNLLIDFQKTDSFGSTALGFLVRLWKKIRDRNGSMALCNLSENEKEILKITKLDSLWPLCDSLEEARRVTRA